MVLVLTSFLAVGLLTLVALVVDLGNSRAVRRQGQSIVDFAALAGGEHLARGNGAEACADAVRYIRLNAPDVPAGTTVPCDQLATVCTGGTAPATVTDEGTADPYGIAITYPVPDDDIRDHRVPGGIREDDGWHCERMRVSVEKTNDAFFAGVIGVDSLHVKASAVARRVPYSAGRIPNLWLLDPYRCKSLLVEGSSDLTVGSVDPPIGGLIALDSTGAACSGSEWTIDVWGAETRVRAVPDTVYPPGQISLVALRPGQQLCSDPGNPHACQQDDVTDGLMAPQPVRREERATRALVDHIFNCRASYPDYASKAPGYPDIPIEGCAAAGTQPPHIDQLRAGLASTPPSDFQVWTAAGYACDQPTLPPELSGNWWVDCPTFRTKKGVDVNFTSGNVVFTGDVLLEGGSILFNSDNPTTGLPCTWQDGIDDCLGASSSDAAFVYLRDGNLTSTAHAGLVATKTAVIQDGGVLHLAGQSPPVWSAPEEGPFRGLSLWSEATSSEYYIAGGASMDLSGVFFTPEADQFQLAGGAPQSAQHAQFIARRLRISGKAKLTLVPLAQALVPLPPPAAILIR